MKNNILICNEINGNSSTFYYKLSTKKDDFGTQHDIKIYDSESYEGDWVEVTVKELKNENLKIEVINAPNDQRYRKKGIPEAIIKELSNIFGKTICSSTNVYEYKTCKNESRNMNANKYWQRLVSSGHAIYNDEEDIYFSKVRE